MESVIKSRLVIITGEKGIGKSTLCRKVVNNLVGRGVTCGGIITLKKENSELWVENISTGKQEMLASVKATSIGPRAGKYYFKPEGLEFGMQAIKEATGVDVLLVDELGHLETRGGGFSPAISLINGRSGRSVVVIRRELLSIITPKFTTKPIVFSATTSNRDELPALIALELAPIHHTVTLL